MSIHFSKKSLEYDRTKFAEGAISLKPKFKSGDYVTVLDYRWANLDIDSSKRCSTYFWISSMDHYIGTVQRIDSIIDRGNRGSGIANYRLKGLTQGWCELWLTPTVFLDEELFEI